MTKPKDTSSSLMAGLSNEVGFSEMLENIQDSSSLFEIFGVGSKKHRVVVTGVCIFNTMEKDFEKALRDAGAKNVDIRNWSAPGMTVEYAAQHTELLKKMVKADSIDAILVFKGANDLLQGRPIADIEADLDRFIGAMKETGVPVAMVGLKASDLKAIAATYPPEYVAQAEAMFPKVAKKHGVPIYSSLFAGLEKGDFLDLGKNSSDLINPFGESYQFGEDGMWELVNAGYDAVMGHGGMLHPDPSGQAKIAQALAGFLAENKMLGVENSALSKPVEVPEGWHAPLKIPASKEKLVEDKTPPRK